MYKPCKMNTFTVTLTPDKLQEIYTDENFRNAVAYAHQSCDKDGKFKHFETCTYPTRYKVTPEQIQEAQTEKDRVTNEKLQNIGNKLVFVGMGMTYAPQFADDVCNHRIRTYFENAEGTRFFMELSKSGRNHETAHVSHAIKDPDTDNEINNYKGIEYNCTPKYAIGAILDFVNKQFNCHFMEIEIDNYNLSCEQFTCKSPKA